MRMGRTPQDRISQRQLVYELRMALDQAVRTDNWTRVDALIADNPRSCFSRFVTYNIGGRRTVWLSDRARRLSAASLRPTRSLA